MSDAHMQMQLAYIEQWNKLKQLHDVNAALLEAGIDLYEALIYHQADSDEVETAHHALGAAIDKVSVVMRMFAIAKAEGKS